MYEGIPKIRGFVRVSKRGLSTLLFYIFRLFPLQNKVVATTFRGKKYGDNPQYIIEKIHQINPSIRIVWLKDKKFSYYLPDFIHAIPFYADIRKSYEMATAKVWIDSHRIESHIRKRKGQLFIETWHGGLGIKKIQQDVDNVAESKWQIKEIKNTCHLADVFISNSKHLTDIYRRAFKYNGKIWKCGYPKNDILINNDPSIYAKVRNNLNISQDDKIFLYAPTFRESENNSKTSLSPYSINWSQIESILTHYWGGAWKILVRWHPSMISGNSDLQLPHEDYLIDATAYPDMQELILASDAFLSDYSSGIFDAALRKIPCFTYAADYDFYKKNHGVYYDLADLPFPFAKNQAELEENLKKYANQFDKIGWDEFAKKTGLHETGHAAKDIANIINEFISGNTHILSSIQSE